MSEPQIWTALGILAATLATLVTVLLTGLFRVLRAEFAGLGYRIEKVEIQLGARIDKVEVELGARIDKVDARIDGVETRIGGIEKRIDSIDRDVQALVKRSFGLDRGA